MAARDDLSQGVVIACSGGSDSVAAALCTWAAFNGRRDQVILAHLNHGLRGVAGEADARFVRHLAAWMEVPYHESELTWDREETVNEEVLRESRILFYQDIPFPNPIRQRLVVTGHHLNDVAETQIMRLTRGSSSDGMSAPRPVTETMRGLTLVRPLLNWTKEAIRQALQELGLSWREDLSNQEAFFFRNRVRNEVLPVLERAAPTSPLPGFELSRQLLEEDATALNAWVDSLYDSFPGEGEALPLHPLRGKPKAIWRRVLHRWLNAQDLGGVFSGEGIEELLYQMRHADPETKIRRSAGAADFIVIQGGRLEKAVDLPAVAWSPVRLVPGDLHLLRTGAQIQCMEVVVNKDLINQVQSGMLDPGKVCILDLDSLRKSGYSGSVLLRRWKAGDRYRPLGSPGTQKLQDSFTDRGISRRERNQRPIVCLQENNQILWCPGLLPADQHKVTHTTDKALWLTYQDTSTAS